MSVFNETKRFPQWWLQLIYLGLLGFLMYMFYTWFILKEAVGNISAQGHPGQIVTIVLLPFYVALIYMFRLKTIIDQNGIQYQFKPFNVSKNIRWCELKKCYVRTYRPIKEYGGRGYRLSFNKDKALNVKENKGIPLEFKDAKKLLKGPQKKKMLKR